MSYSGLFLRVKLIDFVTWRLIRWAPKRDWAKRWWHWSWPALRVVMRPRAVRLCDCDSVRPELLKNATSSLDS